MEKVFITGVPDNYNYEEALEGVLAALRRVTAPDLRLPGLVVFNRWEKSTYLETLCILEILENIAESIGETVYEIIGEMIRLRAVIIRPKDPSRFKVYEEQASQHFQVARLPGLREHLDISGYQEAATQTEPGTEDDGGAPERRDGVDVKIQVFISCISMQVLSSLMVLANARPGNIGGGGGGFGGGGFGGPSGGGGFGLDSYAAPVGGGSGGGGGSYGAPAPQPQYGVPQQAPVIHKHVYVHVPPPEPTYYAPKKALPPPPPPQKHYKIVFIKAPTPPPPTVPDIPPIAPPAEQKTLIYVLVKKPEEAPEITIPTPAPTKPSKPEVYFIRYKTQKQEGYPPAQPPSSDYGPPASAPGSNYGAPAAPSAPSGQYGAPSGGGGGPY
ncbi:WAS/WASL-interacting protein family member 3-like [Anabrus simplex]|uniref:WAS/WASL-interacting protein family member 3-like n=1 Tax=Anabrus simplex TaxID=316456 RepID=UPI0035A2709D